MSQVTGYWAPEGFQKDLQFEVRGIEQDFKFLLLSSQKQPRPVWAENIWYDVQIEKVKDSRYAVEILRSAGQRWVFHELEQNRLSYEIQRNVPSPTSEPIEFLSQKPSHGFGAWTIVNKDTLIFASKTESRFPYGRVEFIPHKSPPNRAYLKLWEFFTTLSEPPHIGDLCVDLGASPGGWTWVMQSLGCKVLAIDRSPLAPQVGKLKNVKFKTGDAFSFDPKSLDKRIDWLLSDVVCYPPKLFTYIKKCVESGVVKNIICTIKFQGATDFKSIRDFLSIPGSQCVHLCHNKHELTWYYKAPQL